MFKTTKNGIFGLKKRQDFWTEIILFSTFQVNVQQQQDPNGNNIEVEAFGFAEAASGAQARECDEAVAHVESDQIQEIIIETPDEDLLANNTMVPELFAKVNNAAKRTGSFALFRKKRFMLDEIV